MKNPFKKKQAARLPEPITIAGIYTVCWKLGLGKSYRREYEGRQMLVEMLSGRTAIYRYADFEIASNVDWDWHIFHFERYLEPGEVLDLPRYA